MTITGLAKPENVVPERETAASQLAVRLLVVFLLTLPLTNVLGPAGWAPPPFLAALGVFLCLLVSNRIYFTIADFPFFLLLVSVTIPWTWSLGYITPKTLVHFLAVVASAICYYFSIRAALIFLRRSNRFGIVYKFLYLSLIYTSIFVLLEAYVRNFTSLDLDSLVPYITRSEFKVTIVSLIDRPRGFATESGIMALFYELAVFLVLPYAMETRRRITLLIMIVLPAYVLLFSAASYAAMAIAGSIYFVAKSKNIFKSTIYLAIAFAIVSSILLYYIGDYIVKIFQSYILPKFSLFSAPGAAESLSSSDRMMRYQDIVNLLQDYPFGIGFGITPGLAEQNMSYAGHLLMAGQVSLPGTFAVAGGIPALVVVVFIAIRFLAKATRLEDMKPELFCAALSLSLHHLFVTEFWVPYLWFVWALIDAFARSAKMD